MDKDGITSATTLQLESCQKATILNIAQRKAVLSQNLSLLIDQKKSVFSRLGKFMYRDNQVAQMFKKAKQNNERNKTFVVLAEPR